MGRVLRSSYVGWNLRRGGLAWEERISEFLA